MKRFALLAILIAFSFLNLNCQTINIPGDYPTIQQGITAASEGDTVLVSPGIYYENLVISGTNMTLASLFVTTNDTSYISTTIIDGSQAGPVIKVLNGIDSTTLICGFSIVNGKSDQDGGGLYIAYSSPVLDHLYIIGNYALSSGGGLYVYFCEAVIQNCRIEQNFASYYGGGIYTYQSAPRMSDLVILENHANSRGGGIDILSSDPVMYNILIEGNSCGSVGGGLVIGYGNSKIVLTGVNIISNTAYDGAGIYNNRELNFKNGLVSGNIASRYGGGIYSRDSLRIFNSEISSNSANYGGGIYIDASFAKIDTVEIANNNAMRYGGGIYCNATSGASLNQSAINANNAVWSGGGIYCYQQNELMLSGSAITYNHSGIGGGLSSYSDQSVTFDTANRCNIYLNSADNYGNDLYSVSDTFEIIVDTFTVMHPTEFHAENRLNFIFDILTGKTDQVDADLYVSPSGNDTNSGLTPEEPMLTIRNAFSRLRADAGHINTIHLANGTYSPSTGQKFPLHLINYGSIAGESMEQTILDAEGASTAIIIKNDTIPLIEELTIKGGNSFAGGGINSVNSEFHGLKLLLTGNSSEYYGGGAYIINNKNSSLVNSIVSNNTTVNDGGGVYAKDSGMEFYQVEFMNNLAMYGGGIAMITCDTFMMNKLKFSGNLAYSMGGGLYAQQTSSLNIVSSEFDANIAADGGGVYSRHSSAVISNSLFTNNTGIHTGSGVELYYDYQADSTDIESRIINVTFANNTTPALFCYNAGVSLINDIFWGNAGPYQVQLQETDTLTDTLRLMYSTIQEGMNGIGVTGPAVINWLVGNIDSDPLFMEAGEYPYVLDWGSPCIEAGTPDTTGLFLPYNDIIGNTRVWDGDGNGTHLIDMGAYEYGAPVLLPGSDPHIIHSANAILIYPNPAYDQVTIKRLNPHDKMFISLLNSVGLCLQFLIIPSGQEKLVIDLKSLSQGVYFIIMKDETGVCSYEKLIIRK